MVELVCCRGKCKYNTIDALIKKMREETEGMQVITVGVSSGGFIAAILASSLKASYCLDFAGQFSLLHHWTHVDTNPFLKELYSKKWTLLWRSIYVFWGGSNILILNQPYVSKTLNRLNMQKCDSNVKILRVRSKNAWMCYITCCIKEGDVLRRGTAGKNCISRVKIR